MHMTSQRHPEQTRAARVSGFSLVEVMVALIVVSVGLLGVAKMHAAAYSSGGTASMRSLAAIEAASLASMMRANRAYWANGLAPAVIAISGTTISDATLAAAATTANYCTTSGSAPCSPATLAAYDLHRWAAALSAMLPSPSANISCAAITPPVSCTIRVDWLEKIVAVNAQGAAGPAMQAPSYTLYVEP
jgi:type IV pilus assembly protein PilV